MDVALGYLSMGVTSTTEWERFARDFLAVDPVWVDAPGGDLLLRMDDHAFRYLLRPSGEDDLREVGWEVASRYDLERIRDLLNARGVGFDDGSFDAQTRLSAIEHIVFTDPDGLRSVVYTAPLLPRAPVALPRGHRGFVTGVLGVGHIVLACSSMEETLDFYQDVLDFRISDYVTMDNSIEGKPVVFMHCNPRHHTVAYFEGSATKRLNHILFQCKSFDDVGMALDVAKEQQFDLVQELGKHSNDWMTSFYTLSPSAFEVEYGWGARTIDDGTWVVSSYDHVAKWGHQRHKPHGGLA